MALDKQKEHSMYLTTVINDVKGTMSIVERIQNNPQMQGDHLKLPMEELLRVATELSNIVTDQEEKAKTNGGFCLFAHDFLSGPKEQQTLEQLRSHLVASKNTLTLGIIADLAPSGSSLLVNDVRMSGISYQQNGRVIRQEGGQDFDHITVRGVTMSDAAFMMNSTVTEQQQDRLSNQYDQRFRLEQLTSLMKDTNIDRAFQADIFRLITEGFTKK